MLLGIFYALLRLPYVQTALVKCITERVERSTGVKIQVGGVDFRPMKSLVLRDVLLRDFRNDTLVFCENLRVKADSFNLVNRSFTIQEMIFDKACFHLEVMRGEDAALMNIEMFIDSLKGRQQPLTETPQEQGGRGWLVGLEKISVRNSHFTYREDQYESVDYGVNWTDVDCHDLNVDVSEFHFGDDYTGMRVAGLRLKEKSGLDIRQLDGKVVMRSGCMVITESKIELAGSNVDLIKLEYNWTPGQRDWRNFVTKMKQYYEIGPSHVSFIDLAYFNGVLRGIDNTVRCSGIVSNTIDSLEGRDLYFEIGEKSVMQGQFKSSGLPDVRHTLFNIELSNAHINPEDLESVYLPWFDMHIPVPSPLHKLEYVDLSRVRFDGILSDFIVTAHSVTPALGGDLKFVYAPCGKDSADCVRMSGDFNFDRLDFGKFIGSGFVKNGALSGTFNGTIDDEGPAFNMKGKLNRLNFRQGNIKDVDLFMTWMGDELDFLSSFDNDDAGGNVVASCDMSDSLQFISLRGYLNVRDLNHYGFSLSGPGESVATSFDMVSAGTGNHSFSKLTFGDFNYTSPAGHFDVGNIGIDAIRNGEYNTINLESDVADLSVEGTYKDIRPLGFASELLRNYLPAYASAKKQQKKAVKTDLRKVDFRFNADVKDANRVLNVIYPDLNVSAGCRLASHFRYGDEILNLSLTADTIRYKDFSLVNSVIKIVGDDEHLKMLYSGDRVKYGELYQLYNIRDELTLKNNRLDNKVSWCNWGRRTYSGELIAGVTFIPVGKDRYDTEIDVEPGVIVLSDSVWHVTKSKIRIEGNNINVDNFSIGRNQQFLSVNGKISENPEEKLSINLNRFDMLELNRLLFNNRFLLFGRATGNLTIHDFYKDRLLVSDFDIENWGINRDTLGSLRLRSYWDADSRSVIIGAQNRVGNNIPLTIAGYYIPASDTLNVDIKLEQVGLDRLGSYASDLVSETSGGLSGSVNISGMASQPDISGYLQLDSVKMKVNALNSKFFINDKVHIVNNRLLFNNFAVWDANNSRTLVNGVYEIRENKYDLKMTFRDFMFLNTAFSDNESMYGRVFLSGLAELNNRNRMTNITVNARTENNSKLYIPLSESVSTQTNNFLHFVNGSQTSRRRNLVVNQENNNINLDVNLEVNDHLEVDVVFDPTVGDVLHVNGGGNIKIVLDKDGGVGMFGEYKITKGNYQFTLSNLVMNKNFILKPGGTIAWNGAPYDAMLNINAVYNLKTSLAELLPETISGGEAGGQTGDTQEKGRKVPVECILNLSDNLVNPLVKFDLNFPTLESQTRSYVQSLFSSQDEINKQMFALLVMGKFYRTDATDPRWGEQARVAGVSTVTEMISSQLSRWLSQISNRVDIGLAYRVADHQVTTDEIEVALSTQLLNDRITLSANGNMDVGNTATGNSNTNNIAGDFDLEVKLNRQGTLKMKAYSHTDEKLIYNNTETIQGVGVSYQESFDTLRELARKYLSFFRRKKDK